MRQGEVYWCSFDGLGSEPSGRRPAIVLQDDRFNQTAIRTTIVLAITSNLRLAEMPGNVRLRKGEARLPKASVVNVTQLHTLDRRRLGQRIGALSHERLDAVLHCLKVVFGIEGVNEPT